MPWVWSAVWWQSCWLVTGDLLDRIAGAVGFFHPLLLGSLMKLSLSRAPGHEEREPVGKTQSRLVGCFLTNVNMITSWYLKLLCSHQQKDIKSRTGVCNRIGICYWCMLCKWGFLTVEELKGLFTVVDLNTELVYNLLEYRTLLLQKGFFCTLD